jgi:hypothetical protein
MHEVWLNEWFNRDFGYYGAWSASFFLPYSNPNLEPTRTRAYEMGGRFQLNTYANLDLTVFYKDIRNASGFHTIPDTNGVIPHIIQNEETAFSRGFTAGLELNGGRRLQGRLYYTFSDAQGTASSFDDHWLIARYETWSTEGPLYPEEPHPMVYDIRHKGTALLMIRSLEKDGPAWGGLYPLGDWSLGLTFHFHSGRPYNRIPNGLSEVYGYTIPAPFEAYNQGRMPWFYQLDGKLEKTFHIGPVGLTFYCWCINVLGTKSMIDVFPGTGRADTDGYLESEAGLERFEIIQSYYGEQAAEDYKKWYQAILTGCGSFGYQMPRQLRLGIKIDLF